MKKTQILLICLVVLLYSCGPVSTPRKFYEYHSSSLGALKTYTTKPAYKGKKEKALYVSANFSDGVQSQNKSNSKDVKKAGVFSAHRSVTDEYYNLHYGIGATYGEYKFGNSLGNFVINNEKKDYYAINLKSGINFKKSIKKVDFRIIGLELAYNYENGSYYKKIAELPTGNIDPGYYNIKVKKPKSVFSYNFNTEIVFKFNAENNLGMGMFLGQTALCSDSFNFSGFTISYNYKKVTASLVYENLNSLSNNTYIKNIKYGLTYELFSKQNKKSKKLTKNKNITNF